MAEPPEQSAPLETSPAADAAADEVAPLSPIDLKNQGTQSGESRRFSRVQGLWTFVVRLVILGFGVSLGWIMGVLVAQVFPANNPNPPIQEVVMRRTSETWRKLQQLPRWWRGDAADSADLDLAMSEESLSPPVTESTPRLTLSPDLQEQVQTDLDLLRTDLDELESRLTDIENRLGEPPATEQPLETRLQSIERLVSPPGADLPPATLPPPPDATAAATEGTGVYQEPPFSLVTDSIVLPSSLLFEPGGSLLTPAGKQLLDTIVPDLRQYPEATLLVGSHTASDKAPEADRRLTFQQAMAVQRYLDQQLAETGMHWVTLGYGQTRPRVIGTGPEAQQRNRRIEIGIVPR